MLISFSYLHQYLSNIFGHLSNISYHFFNNPITSYCAIFIIVFLILLGFVLFAEQITTIPVDSLLDTEQDLERRTNDNRISLNLVFQQNVTGLGPSPFLIDRNDTTGLRMARLLPNRAGSFRIINGRGGFVYRQHINQSTGINNQGDLLIHVFNFSLGAVESNRTILSRGLPVQRAAHPTRSNTETVLTILPDYNVNANTN
jgi:hypothetical protein